MVACQHSSIPVINAGDGGHQHPTQTLTDLLTIRNLKGRLNNLTIGLCGDLKFGRTVHSLIHALVRYTGIRFVLISPEELRLPGLYPSGCARRKQEIPYREVRPPRRRASGTGYPLYDPRTERTFLQRRRLCPHERFLHSGQKENAARAGRYADVMHPLPRVNEISVEVDDDPRAAYFRQVQYGVYVRMALILTLLDIHVDKPTGKERGKIW